MNEKAYVIHNRTSGKNFDPEYGEWTKETIPLTRSTADLYLEEARATLDKAVEFEIEIRYSA